MIDPTNQCIGGIGRGDGPSARDGRQATFLSTALKGTIQVQQTSFVDGELMPTVVVTMYLVLDKQTNGIQMNSNLPFVSASPSVLPPSQCFVDLSETHRFKILKRKRLVIDANSANLITGTAGELGVGVRNVPFSMYHSFGKGMTVNYLSDNTTGSVAAVTDNSVHFIAFVDQVSGDNDFPSFSTRVAYAVRTRFVSA